MEKGKILTLDIGGSKIHIQTVDENGNFGPETAVSLIGLELDNDKFAELLIKNIKTALADEKNPVSAISIGAPGKVNSEEGLIEGMPNIENVDNFPVVDILKKSFGMPVFVLNDADAGVLGERWIGSGKGYKNLIYLTLSTGVGSGVIVNNELQKGTELGHTSLVIEDRHRECSCGETDHAESYLGTEGLANIYTEVFNVNIEELDKKKKHSISPRMREGIKINDPNWLKVEENYSVYLAEFLDNIIKFYEPEVIILGGGIMYNNISLFNKIKHLFKDRINLALAKFENSTNIGAAKYAFDKTPNLP